MHRWMLCAILLIGLSRLTAQPVRVGDLYTFPDGSKGIVCYVDPENNQKGWVADLNDMPGQYQLYSASSVPSTPTMINRSPNSLSLRTWNPEGLANTTALYQMDDGTNNSPAAQAVDLESGWYIPDAQQMMKMVGMAAILQPAFTKSGGNITRLMQNGRHYWTSTRYSTSSFYYLYNYSYYGGYLSTSSPNSSYYIRRVRDFDLGHSLETYWENNSGDATIQVSPSSDTTMTAFVVYGPDTFEIHQSVYVHPTHNDDTIRVDTVFIGIPYYKDIHNVTFHVNGAGYDTLYDTLGTVNYGCDSILTIILHVTQPKELFFYDTVCQSQVNSYTGPYQSVAFAIFGESTVDSLVKTSGFIYKEKVYMKDGDGNDSTVNIYLTVTPWTEVVDSVTTINLDPNSTGGYYWIDSLYTESGTHTKITQTEKGCDIFNILHLVILDVDTTADTTCAGSPIDLTIPVTTRGDYLIHSSVLLGDVLCTDGSVMRPDDYLSSGKTNAMGVVFLVDENNGYGRAIALSDANSNSYVVWARSYYYNIHSTPKSTITEPLLDIDGATNTNEILRTARLASGTNNTATYAPAAHYCKFYNHHTYTTGTDSLGWYLPAGGELRLIHANRVELNKTLTQLYNQDPRNTLLNKDKYWSSTEYDDNKAWVVFYNGFFHQRNKTDSYYYARPVIQFPLP